MFQPGDRITPRKGQWGKVHDHFQEDGCREAIVISSKGSVHGAPSLLYYKCATHEHFKWEGFIKNWELSGNSDDAMLSKLLR